MSRAATELDDPTWYRIGYSLAAQRLHDAFSREHQEHVHQGELGPRALQIIFDLTGGSDAARRRVQASFEAAEQQARLLIEETAAVLAEAGWQWVGRRPAWYTRRTRRASRRRDPQLAEFLDRTVEPAAVVLLWSARVEQGRAPAVPGPSWGAAPALGRARFGHGDWLERYLAELVRDKWPAGSVFRRMAAWLGYSRFRQASPPVYQVQYNLACLFSRLALQASEGRGDEDMIREYLDICAAWPLPLRGCQRPSRPHGSVGMEGSRPHRVPGA